MTKKNKILTALTGAGAIILTPLAAMAQGMAGLLDQTVGGVYNTGVNKETGIATLLGQIVSITLSLIGVIFIVYVIYGGFLWLTASGNEENIEKAKKIITQGIIAIIITFSAVGIYLIVRQILSPGI